MQKIFSLINEHYKSFLIISINKFDLQLQTIALES